MTAKAIPLTQVPFEMTALNDFIVREPGQKRDPYADGREMFNDRIELADQEKFQRIAKNFGYPHTRKVDREKWCDYVHEKLWDVTRTLAGADMTYDRPMITDVKWNISRVRLDFSEHGSEECWRVEVPGMSCDFQKREIEDQEFFRWQLVYGYGCGVPVMTTKKQWLELLDRKRNEYAEKRRKELEDAYSKKEFKRLHRFRVDEKDGVMDFVFDRPRVGEEAALASDADVYLGEVLSIDGEYAVLGHSGEWNKKFRRTWPLQDICQWPDLEYWYLRKLWEKEETDRVVEVYVPADEETPETFFAWIKRKLREWFE